MPTLIKEDGSTVANANSYVSVAELTAYLSDRGLTWSGTAGAEDAVLIRAMDYLESVSFIGTRASKDQPLQWPRDNVYIDGFSYTATEIPALVQKAQMEVAASIDAGNDPNAAIGRETKREKVGDVEVEYQDGAKESAELVSINRILQKISDSIVSSGVAVVGLSRA